jgi:tetratricopeptide (TPR) repeat protein
VGLGELAEAEVHAGVGEKEAQEIYTAILRRWKSRPAAAEALFRLGQSHQRAGEFEDAAVAYDELLSRPNSTAWQRPARKALESTLRSLSAAGKFVEVANLYLRQEPVLSSPVVDGSTGLLVAGAFSRLGLIDSAIALIQASIAAGVSNAQHEYALVALAEAYRKKGDSQGLESAWKEYLRKFPAGPWSAEARQGLIIALSRVGKQDEAEKTCRAYVEQSRDPAARGDKGAVHEIMLVCADLFVQAGQLESAQHLYRQILKTEEDSVDGAWATYQLGRASRLGGRAGQADEYWERVARTDKDFLLAAVASAQLTGVGGSQRP